MYNVVVIGAGIVGALTARELSKYNLKILLLDKEMEVSNGTTKANSAIVHAGYDPYVGSNKAKLNVEGNRMFSKLCDDLDVPFKRIGSLVVAFSEEEMLKVKELYKRGVANGVPDMEIIQKERLKEIEPNISNDAYGALWARTAGITSPYELCIAACQNAADNGAHIKLDTKVLKIDKLDDGFVVKTSKEDYKTQYIVNAAGLFADEINKMLGGEEFNITPRKGEYCLFDRGQGDLAKHILFQTPTKMGKGILVTPTVHGNLIMGPSSENIYDKYDLSTTDEGLAKVLAEGSRTINEFSRRDIITSFTGLRASVEGGDFIINSPTYGAVNAAGIDSPGLTAAPAIAKELVSMLNQMGLKLEEKDFNTKRHKPKSFRDMTNEEKAKAIEKNPLYGRIICRCETVSEGEIVDAIKGPAGARTVDGVKRRVRAGMGRCQGGFCMPRVVEILSRELNIPYMDVVKDSKDGYIFTGRLKDNLSKGGEAGDK